MWGGSFVCDCRTRVGGGKGVEKQGGSAIILVDRHTGARQDGGVDPRHRRRDGASRLQLPGRGRALPPPWGGGGGLVAKGDHHRRARFVATGALRGDRQSG